MDAEYRRDPLPLTEQFFGAFDPNGGCSLPVRARQQERALEAALEEIDRLRKRLADLEASLDLIARIVDREAA